MELQEKHDLKLNIFSNSFRKFLRFKCTVGACFQESCHFRQSHVFVENAESLGFQSSIYMPWQTENITISGIRNSQKSTHRASLFNFLGKMFAYSIHAKNISWNLLSILVSCSVQKDDDHNTATVLVSCIISWICYCYVYRFDWLYRFFVYLTVTIHVFTLRLCFIWWNFVPLICRLLLNNCWNGANLDFHNFE